MPNTTGIAVGCAVGIPSGIAICVALFFFRKTRRRFAREDVEFQKDTEMRDIDQDLSYDNLDQLRIHSRRSAGHEHTTSTEDSDQERHEKAQDDNYSDNNENGPSTRNLSNSNINNNDNNKRRTRYVPAYRKQMKSQINSVSTSRNSSYSNLPNGGTATASNASITTNSTENFYSNVPVVDGDNKDNSCRNSMELAKSLQIPTPSYSKRPSMNRSSSASTMQYTDDEYDLKNNYDLANEGEIQEEDQYENEFTNYSENKRAFIEGLRPKLEQQQGQQQEQHQ